MSGQSLHAGVGHQQVGLWANLAGDKADGAGVRGRDEDVVQAHLAEQRQCARQAGALLHQQRRPEHEGPHVQERLPSRPRQAPAQKPARRQAQTVSDGISLAFAFASYTILRSQRPPR